MTINLFYKNYNTTPITTPNTPQSYSPMMMERNHHVYGGHSHHMYHHKGSNSKHHRIALSALTLLSFLFFLHILQNCLQDHMMESTTSTPQVVIVQARIRGKEVEKRKGDDEVFDNTTVTKQPEEIHQIPIKLRTWDNQKYIYN